MKIKEVKLKFFAYRNGAVAEALRRSGMPYRMIYGVDVPTLGKIAREIGYDNELAVELWNEKDVRESRLLAAYLFNPAEITMQKAEALCLDAQTQEEADILVFRLLRHLDYASDLLNAIWEKDDGEYASKALKRIMKENDAGLNV